MKKLLKKIFDKIPKKEKPIVFIAGLTPAAVAWFNYDIGFLLFMIVVFGNMSFLKREEKYTFVAVLLLSFASFFATALLIHLR